MFHTLKFEPLEPRRMLTVSWVGGLTGYWDVAGNWSNDAVPTATTAVSIATSGATVTVAPGEADSAGSLTIGPGSTLAMPTGVNAANPTTNLLVNAGFESPVAANSTTPPATWWTWGSPTPYLSTQYAYTGSQSLVLSGTSSETGPTAAQECAAAPGDSYTASVYAMTPAALTGNATAYLNLLFYNSTNDDLLSSDSDAILTSSSGAGGSLAGSVGAAGWNHFYTTEVAPAGAAYAEVQVEIYGGTSSNQVYFDDVELGPTPAGAQGPSKLVVGTASTSGLLSNSGTLSVGPANTVTINGPFTQTSTGTLDIQLGGAPSMGDFGFVDATGAVTLGGTLKADLVNGYSPSTTDSFTPVEYPPDATGSFASDALPSGPGYQFNAAATFTNIVISAAPTTALTATVNASESLHAVATSLLGINMVYWDSDTGMTQTQQMLTAAGLDIYRFPGGSAADDFHFNDATNLSDSGAITIGQFAQAITADGGTGMVTVDYGSGSPQEAAAELAYLDGSATDTTSIGNGIEWNDATGAWQTVNWETVGYWASLRGASPLATNDGLNFLRIEHPAPFSDIKYWEIGNEEYGGNAEYGYWEIDHHGTAGPGGVSTGAAHDPATYAAFADTFALLAGEIQTTAELPPISIGIDSGDPTGDSDSDMVANWTKNVLADGLADGFVPGFISDHNYMQAAGDESDSFLLDDSVSLSGSGNLLNWSTRYNDYQSVLQQTLGSKASSVQVMATEYNSVSPGSVYTAPGKQSTSLVNGLFVAESLGGLLDSGYDAGFVWDLRNYYDTSNDQNDSNLLYGWREGGDYGQLGSASETSLPATSPYTAYPGYYALQLASEIIQSGSEVVSATSNYSDLDVYAVKESSGVLALLVVNVNPAASLTEQFDVTGFQAGGAAEVWQYGETQDTAQSQANSGGASALANWNATLSLSGSNFSYSFPAYSMTVIDLLPPPPTVATAASASPSPVTGTTTALSVLGADTAGESNLTYTWAASGTPPATVTFSANGTNAAKSTTATFSAAGSYSFTVTISDAAGLTTTSSTSVTVNQTFKSVAISPGSSSLEAGGSQQFAATGLDQFDNSLTSQPAFTWSLSGGGSLIASGSYEIYTPPDASGTATVEAASGQTSAAAAVTFSGAAQWVSNVTASWTSSGDWQDTISGVAIAAPGVRGITGDTILLGPSAVGTVDLDGASPSLAAVTFSAAGGSAIAQGTGGSLLLNNGAGPATLTVMAGSDTISAPLVLESSVMVLATAGSQLTISGGISGAGQSLTVDDPGSVVLSGANSYSGGTTVSAGTLIATNASAIPAGTSLTVGAGGTLIFNPSMGAGPAAGVAVAATAIAGPADRVAASVATSAATSADASATTAAPLASSAAFASLGRSVAASALGTPSAERIARPSSAGRIAGDLAWLPQRASNSQSAESSDQQRKKEVAILALDAVFAQYGQ